MLAPTRLRKQSSKHRLDWRWHRAGQLANTGRFDQVLASNDPALLSAVTYVVLLDRCNCPDQHLRLAKCFPEIERAFEIYEAKMFPLQWEIEARILAGQDDQAVGFACGVDPLAITTYEQLFFNVRDRLSATSWIVRHAIGELTATNVGAIWRHYAYWGGPLVLESLIEHYCTTGQRDYQHLWGSRRTTKARCRLHAAIERALYVKLATPHEVESAIKLVPQWLARQTPTMAASDVSTFDLTAMLAKSLQAAAIRRARRAESNPKHCGSFA